MRFETLEMVAQVYTQPFFDLIYQAHSVHRENHNPNTIEQASLLSIKTGACPEDCGYCSQSGHYKTSVEKEKLMSTEQVLRYAQQAKEQGAKRFCMGAAWRCPPTKAMPTLVDMIKEVKKLGLETCMTLGMLTDKDARTLKEAGLDYYSHNIDTSPAFYEKIISTRKFSDRLETLAHVRNAGMQVCCGGIMGMGESRDDRIQFLFTLANLDPYPESVPINRLIPVKGTPLAAAEPIDNIELVRTIATARLLMPKSVVRASRPRTPHCLGGYSTTIKSL